uniref:hypothetical protein n=1 Tax=Salmonella sp. TaxID=599 RepID=UPI001CD96D23|nr:hypothetical protein [Salmonella sp.]
MMLMMNSTDKGGREFATLQANHPQWLAERRADVATDIEELGCRRLRPQWRGVKQEEFEANDERAPD